MNKVILIGHIGILNGLQNPSDSQYITFTLATNESYKDKSGNKVEKTAWHKCIAYGKLAGVINQYVQKGNRIMLEGKIVYSESEKNGIKTYYTNIQVSNFEFLTNKEKNEQREKPPVLPPVEFPLIPEDEPLPF